MEKDIRLIVFDLDGTLYQDTHHFAYYAKRLCEKLPKMKQDDFWRDYQAVLTGTHKLEIGTVFDVEEDLILRQHNGKVIKGYTWDGENVSEEKLHAIYQHKPLSFNFTTMLNVGDLWWVPGSIARHYKITDEAAEKAFTETREYMMTDEFQMEQIKGFSELLHQLSEKKILVLLTNSPESDSEVILSKLGVQAVFDRKIFNGKKPIETKKHLQFLKEHYDVTYDQILSIGDNAINEIFPAKELGCTTILIDPHHIFTGEVADYKVDTIEDYMEILQTEIK